MRKGICLMYKTGSASAELIGLGAGELMEATNRLVDHFRAARMSLGNGKKWASVDFVDRYKKTRGGGGECEKTVK